MQLRALASETEKLVQSIGRRCRQDVDVGGGPGDAEMNADGEAADAVEGDAVYESRIQMSQKRSPRLWRTRVVSTAHGLVPVRQLVRREVRQHPPAPRLRRTMAPQ